MHEHHKYYMERHSGQNSCLYNRIDVHVSIIDIDISISVSIIDIDVSITDVHVSIIDVYPSSEVWGQNARA